MNRRQNRNLSQLKRKRNSNLNSKSLTKGLDYGGQPSRNDRDNPGTGISVPCPGEEVNGTLNCPGIQVNSVSVQSFYTSGRYFREFKLSSQNSRSRLESLDSRNFQNLV
jgi:hypothetical protein